MFSDNRRNLFPFFTQASSYCRINCQFASFLLSFSLAVTCFPRLKSVCIFLYLLPGKLLPPMLEPNKSSEKHEAHSTCVFFKLRLTRDCKAHSSFMGTRRVRVVDGGCQHEQFASSSPVLSHHCDRRESNEESIAFISLLSIFDS